MINKNEIFTEMMLKRNNNKFTKEQITEALEIFYKSPDMCRKIVNIFVANGKGKMALDYDFNPWYEETKDLEIDVTKAKILHAYIQFIDNRRTKELIEYCEKNPIYTYQLQEKLGIAHTIESHFQF